MTRDNFLNMDWNDSHIGYDMKVGHFRNIAYITLSAKYPNCLCLIADNKDFPMKNSGCGISKNPCPADVIEFLNKRTHINRIITIIDGNVYDLDPQIIHINGIDSEVLFNEIPFEKTIFEAFKEEEIEEIE